MNPSEDIDPGTPDADLAAYEQADLFDPSDCGVAK